jgi:uncharacterized damage-inducible protein DinB
VSRPFPEPTDSRESRSAVFVGYLDYFRAVLVAKVGELAPADRSRSRLPSGWTPLELVKHLSYVERRWLEWGFEGADVDDPWGDARAGRWCVAPDEDLSVLAAELDRRAAITRAIVEQHDLTEVGQPGPRWEGAPPPSLERILFHLLQEYARHVGQLDIVVELAGGVVGE